MSLAGKKVLVTGAGGFIGSHLCEALLAAGAEVTALVRYNGRADRGNLERLPKATLAAIEVVFGSIEDPFFVLDLVRGKDIVFHLAALIAIPYSYSSPQSYVRTNVEGTLNILEAIRRNGVARLVQTSTSETYGSALYSPIDEKHPLQGQSPYSASKIGADKLAESYHRSFNVPVATLRPFNTFGPRQSARAVIPTIIMQALAEPAIQLGSLDPVRDLTFVEDTAAAFLAIAGCDAALGDVVNAGNGLGITIGDLARVIVDLMGVDKPIVTDPQRVRPGTSEVKHLICDRAKAGQLMGWAPRTSLKEGLGRTIEFVRTHLAHYQTDRYVR